MKRIIWIVVVLSVLCMFVLPVGATEGDVAYKPFIHCDFDGLADGFSLNPATEAEESASYSGTVGNFYMVGKQGVPITSGVAPAGKREGTNLSVGDIDKAIALNVGAANKNPYINSTLSATANTMGNLKLSFNIYVESYHAGPSYAMVNAMFRSKDSSYANLIAFRSNGQIQSFDASNTGAYFMKFDKGGWYYCEFIIDATTNTYSIVINGEVKETGKQVAAGLHFDPAGNANKRINQIRFTVSNSTTVSQPTKTYIDDVFFGIETERPTPAFSKTTHQSGTDGYNQVDVPKDLKGIEAVFPRNMDESSFENNVTLTRGDDNIPVPFTGVYDAATMTYRANIIGKALPYTQYKLTFDGKIKTSQDQENDIYAGVSLGNPETISLITEIVDFAVLDNYFTDTATKENRIDSIINADGTIYANVDALYTNLLDSERHIGVFVIRYQNGHLEHVSMRSVLVQPATESGAKFVNIQIPIDLSQISIDENTVFELAVWDDVENRVPLIKSASITK